MAISPRGFACLQVCRDIRSASFRARPSAISRSGRWRWKPPGRLPAAIGAQFAAPDRIVIDIDGDSSIRMNLGELETARRMGLGLTVIVVNNAASGYVKALQHLMYGEGNYQSSDLAETNYAKLAEAMGCKGRMVSDPAELGAGSETRAQHNHSRFGAGLRPRRNSRRPGGSPRPSAGAARRSGSPRRAGGRRGWS